MLFNHRDNSILRLFRIMHLKGSGDSNGKRNGKIIKKKRKKERKKRKKERKKGWKHIASLCKLILGV